MDRIRAVVVGALTVLALGGCIGIPLSQSKVEETLQTTAFEVGVADRVEVRQALGQPILSSEYWRFDAFRIQDWNSGVVFFTYVPIPTWEKNEGFALVAYQENGRVADFAFGHRARGFWIVASAEPETVVETGDLQLWTSDDQLYLAASPKLRDAYLSRSVPEGSCRVVLAGERREYPVRVHVNAASSVSDVGAMIGARPSEPPDTIVWNGAVVTVNESMVLKPLHVLTLTAGSHRIDAVPVVGRDPIPASVQFDCDSGATRYAILRVEWQGESGVMSRKLRYRAVIEIMKERPSDLELRPLLIWGHGKWQVEAEPRT